MNIIHDVPHVGCGNTGAAPPGNTRIQEQNLHTPQPWTVLDRRS